MSPTEAIGKRQIWALPSTTTASHYHHCTPFHLPSKGVISIGPSSVITLSQNAVFDPECSGIPTGDVSNYSSPIIDLRDPFYASTSPQIYAIATATVISWMLVIMLFITPRTYFVGGPGGGRGFLGHSGMMGGVTGNIIGVGGRPLLQKVATITVAISLTIATVSTFRVAEEQYNLGYQDAVALTDEVVGGLELRVIRTISQTFLWLAQVQTLIRLFPRHREKIIIKWTGFALIVLDTAFSIPNNFFDNSAKTRPRNFTDAIPALTYLFELALSVLYASWVIYYALHKRRFAFFHPLMRNIFLVAVISIVAISIPVVFFVLDIAKPNLAGWGDYMRWVGAAAASVVVWEWVERIEALEREERKDGILGREVFEGDEMLEATPSVEGDWPRRRPGNTGSNATGRSGAGSAAHRENRSGGPSQYNRQRSGDLRGSSRRNHVTASTGGILGARLQTHNGPTPPQPVASPVSRADTTSAASTVYAVRYHPISESTSPGPGFQSMGNLLSSQAVDAVRSQPTESTSTQETEANKRIANIITISETMLDETRSTMGRLNRWQNATNPFKRRRTSPPSQISQAAAAVSFPETRQQAETSARRATIFGRLAFGRQPKAADASLPVMVIPVPSQGRVWSPAISDENSPGFNDKDSDTSSQAPAVTISQEARAGPDISRSQSVSRGPSIVAGLQPRIITSTQQSSTSTNSPSSNQSHICASRNIPDADETDEIRPTRPP